MWLFTATAPAVLAMRVAAPLCWIMSVLPSIVTTPPCTLKRNLSGTDLRFHKLGPNGGLNLYIRKMGRRTGFCGRSSLVDGVTGRS